MDYFSKLPYACTRALDLHFLFIYLLNVFNLY